MIDFALAKITWATVFQECGCRTEKGNRGFDGCSGGRKISLQNGDSTGNITIKHCVSVEHS